MAAHPHQTGRAAGPRRRRLGLRNQGKAGGRRASRCRARADHVHPNVTALVIQVRRPGAGERPHRRLGGRVDALAGVALHGDNGAGQDDRATTRIERGVSIGSRLAKSSASATCVWQSMNPARSGGRSVDAVVTVKTGAHIDDPVPLDDNIGDTCPAGPGVENGPAAQQGSRHVPQHRTTRPDTGGQLVGRAEMRTCTDLRSARGHRSRHSQPTPPDPKSNA